MQLRSYLIAAVRKLVSQIFPHGTLLAGSSPLHKELVSGSSKHTNDTCIAMKRKLDKNDEPVAVAPEPEAEPKTESKPSQPENQAAENEPSFAELGLDPRLVQAIAKQNFEKPTLVQRKAIPLALKGQDVLCKAKTGSGKTAAYVLPILSSILKRKAVCEHPRHVSPPFYLIPSSPSSFLH